MPLNFPEIWLKRVIENLDKSDVATFLEGIAELDADVTAINEGSMSEQNKMYVAESTFEVEVLINNTTYPIEVQEYEDGTIEITLNKFQTKVTTLSDDQIIGASYDKIDKVTKSHVRAIRTNRYKLAIHAIAPSENTDATPVMTMAGEKLTYTDLVNFKDACDKAGFGDGTRRLVLCETHWNHLLLDRENFGDQLVNYKKGEPAPEIAGFELHRYSKMPMYDNTGVKNAFDATTLETDVECSVAFVVEGIAKKTGMTKQYFTPASSDTETQANKLNYRHYFVAIPFQAARVGAILSQATA